MKPDQLASLCLRIRSLFKGEVEEDIFALHVKWMKDRDFAVCSEALDRYALDFGGERGRFIPSKFREYHDAQRTAQAEKRKKETKPMDLGVTHVDVEWSRIRKEIAEAGDARAEAVRYLESLGWVQPEQPLERWPRTWLLAVRDIASDAEVNGIPARAFWAAVPPRRPKPSTPKQGR